MIGSRLDATRASLRHLAAAIPDLPAQLGIVWATLTSELRQHGTLGLVGALAGLAVLGTLADALFWRGTGGLRDRITALPVETAEDRLRAVAWRLLYGTGHIGAFAAGSVGAFSRLTGRRFFRKSCSLI